jgi:hypothetical protein
LTPDRSFPFRTATRNRELTMHVLGLSGSLRWIPPFDEDAEGGPVPPAVADLRRRTAEADALLIATRR